MVPLFVLILIAAVLCGIGITCEPQLPSLPRHGIQVNKTRRAKKECVLLVASTFHETRMPRIFRFTRRPQRHGATVDAKQAIFDGAALT
jgi:hypothetical protein